MSYLKFFEKSVLHWIGATRGGPMRALIMKELFQKPMNANQLALELNVDYKTITHHLDKLVKNNWVVRRSEKYAGQYHPAFTEEEKDVFLKITHRIGKKI